ncbi:MAG: polysaccharide biosynthesis C-terminal domain-containing protein [Gammaproteobacteria bacterium]
MKLTNNAAWLIGCRVSGDLLNLLLFVIISRHLGPAGIGAYSYGFAVSTFVFVIGCLGIEEYGLRRFARIESDRRASFFAELLGAQLLMIAVAIVGVAVYLALTRATHATILTVALLTAFQASVAIARTLFIPSMSQQRMMLPAVADLLMRALAFGIAGLTIQFSNVALPLSLIGFPVSAVLLMIVGSQSAARYGAPVRVAISRPTLSGIAAVLWSFALIEVFVQLLSRVGVIALTLHSGQAAAGVFATGLRLVEVTLMPLAFLGVAAYPRLSQLYVSNTEEFRRDSSQLMWLMVLVSAGSAWGLTFIAPVLLVPVLGARFAGMEPAVAAMAFVAVVQGLEVTLGRLLYSSDRQVRRAWIIVAGAALNTVLCVLLVPRAGVYGAIAAGAASYAMIDIAYALTLRRPVTARRLLLILAALAAGLALGATVTAVFAGWALPLWARALGSAAAFLAVVGSTYWYASARSAPL